MSEVISKQIETMENLNRKKVVKILDYGSGFNPILIERIIDILSIKYKNTKFKAYCYDYYNKNLNKKILDLQVIRVNATGTTATGIIALEVK